MMASSGVHAFWNLRLPRHTTLRKLQMKTLLRSLLLSLLISLSATAATLSGKVVGVSDGDTITVLDAAKVQTKIRLAGIDAPEKSQAFGNRSKQHLSDLVYQKTVDIDWNKTDKYGRTIGKVIVAGKDANLAQIRAGLAWHYKAYEKEQSTKDRSDYAQVEGDARTRKLGLWADAKPIPPWDYRHGTGEASPENRIQAGESCPCGSNVTCTGTKGGIYCLTPSGRKKYH